MYLTKEHADAELSNAVSLPVRNARSRFPAR